MVCYNWNMRKGFTLIEMLIVVAISAMLASIAITYSGTERDQIALSVEQTKIAQFVLQARSLALATYASQPGTLVCGYGVFFDTTANTYSIFAYQPPATTTCPAESSLSWSSIANNEVLYTQEAWKVQPGSHITFTASSGGVGVSSPMVFFYPPNPDVFFFDSAGNPLTNLSISLRGAGGETPPPITIDTAGQVNFSN